MSDLREDSPWGEVGRIVAERDALRAEVDKLRELVVLLGDQARQVGRKVDELAEPEPEREVLELWVTVDGVRSWLRHAVPAEALRPGDRVAGRVVESVVPSTFDRGVLVGRDGDQFEAFYPPGVLVLLDAEDDQ